MAYILNGASPLSHIMLFPPHGTRERVVFDNFITRSHTHLIISIPSIHVVSPFSRHNASAHLAWVVTRPGCQTARNRLKIGARREGTVSDDILESHCPTRTDGGDPASICSGARRFSAGSARFDAPTLLRPKQDARAPLRLRKKGKRREC